MTVTPKRLVSGSLLTAAAATYYTATNVKARIDKCTVTNDYSAAETVTIHLVPSGGSADNTNRIVKAKSLQPGETYTCPEAVGHVLEAGGTIQALASNAARVMLAVSGVEVS